MCDYFTINYKNKLPFFSFILLLYEWPLPVSPKNQLLQELLTQITTCFVSCSIVIQGEIYPSIQQKTDQNAMQLQRMMSFV